MTVRKVGGLETLLEVLRGGETREEMVLLFGMLWMCTLMGA